MKGAELDSLQRDAVDRAARVAREDTTRRVLIRHTDRSAPLAERVEGRLIDDEVDQDRIRRSRVPGVHVGSGPARADAIELVILRASEKER